MTTGLGAVLVLLSIIVGVVAAVGLGLYAPDPGPLVGLGLLIFLPGSALWYSQRLASRRPGGL